MAIPALGIAALAGVGALIVWGHLALPPGPPVPWARLATTDVHSLAFAPGTTGRLYFGHHGGVLESLDGGRSWRALSVRADAMSLRPAGDGSIVIAGHDVLVASRHGGVAWAAIASNLPNIDSHAFARDPGDSARMWA